MQKFDNFLNSFRVLKNSKRELALSDEIYRTGVIGQFSLTFELLWKTLQEVEKFSNAMREKIFELEENPS